MILVELRGAGGAGKTIAVHPGATVIGGLDPAARREWAAALTQALRGEDAGLGVTVELDGEPQRLTPELARRLGFGDAASAVAVFAADLPGAKPAVPGAGTEAATEPLDADVAAREAEVAAAEAKAGRLRTELAEAKREATAAADARTTAGRQVDRDAAGRVTAAEERLTKARLAVTEARRALKAAEQRSANRAQAAEQGAQRVEQLRSDRSRLEAERASLVARMVEAGDPGDAAPVTAALAALQRLRQVRPKPSTEAVELADRWVEACAHLSSLPQPPQPPEWLVTPALSALQEAREVLAEAEAAKAPAAVDPGQAEVLDRAHREVLEAEQRAMKKGSRLNRRRLDAAHEAEQAALAALGVNSYGEYLQRVAPAADEAGRESRTIAAREALADAEAVWEELHGGEASPQWTAAKEEQAAVRDDALALLGRDVDDADLEESLRAHLEVVVESGWAEQELATALTKAGAPLPEGEDVEEAATRWLEEAPSLREARAALATELTELDGRLAAAEEELANGQANASTGDAEEVHEGPAGEPTVAAAHAAIEAAMGAEREAEQALARARERQAASETEQAKLLPLEQAADGRRAAVDQLAAALAEAEHALEVLQGPKAGDAGDARAAKAPRQPAPKAASKATPPPAAEPGVDLSGVIGMEAEAYLLARVAALRGATGGPLPLVVDVDAVAGLSDGAARRVLRLLGRLVDSVQVVVLGDDARVATWAEGLGDRAAVRSVAR